MGNDSGRTVKILASILLVIGLIFSVEICRNLFDVNPGYAILSLVGGVFAFSLVAYPLYAFGCHVKKTEETNDLIDMLLKNSDEILELLKKEKDNRE